MVDVAVANEIQKVREQGCDCIRFDLIGIYRCGNGHIHVTLIHSRDCDLGAEQYKQASLIAAAPWN